MSNTTNTLEDIIATAFDGNKSALAKLAGVSAPTLTKLTSGTIPNSKTLGLLCDHLLPDDARRLCLAVCRDILPPEFQGELSISSGKPCLEPNILRERTAEYHTGTTLDQRSLDILAKIKRLAESEPETKAWLHKIGDWILDE